MSDIETSRYADQAKNEGSLQRCVIKHRPKMVGSTPKSMVLFIEQGTIIEVHLALSLRDGARVGA